MLGVGPGALFSGLILFPRSERVKTDPRNIDTFGGLFPAVLSLESCGFCFEKCGCFGGPNKLVHFSGKVLDLIMGRLSGCGHEACEVQIGAVTKAVWVALGLIGVIAGATWAILGAAGMVIGAVEAALGAAAPFWLGGVKQNSSETKPLSCEHLVGVRRFELLTSSVSGKRSPPELNARSRVRECAGNNITELPPSGKNYFLKSGDLRPYPPRCSANSTRKVAFVSPTNSTFA